MKKFLFTLMAMAMPAVAAMAQNEPGSWTLTPKVGLNIARMTDPDIYIDISNEKIEYGNKVALAAGVETEYQLTDRLALAVELLYSNQGYRMKDNSAFRDGTATLHCLNLPLTAKYYFAPGLAFRIGVQPGYAMSRKTENDTNDGKGHWTHSSTSDTWFHRFDLSIPFGLTYNIGPLELDARYNLGLTNTTKYDALKLHNRVLQLSVGYRFSLN